MGGKICADNAMKYIGYQDEDNAEKWASKKLGVKGKPELFRALSAVNDDGEFCCVILLTNFSPRNIDINIVVDGVLTPKNTVLMFNGLFRMVFDQLKAVRATALVAQSNTPCQSLVTTAGFVKEGVMRKAYDDDEDMVIYSILDNEYREHNWFRGVK